MRNSVAALCLMIMMPALCFGESSVPSSEGENACLSKEIIRITGKAVQDLKVTHVEGSFWGWYSFEAEDGKKNPYTGHLYAKVWERKNVITCALDRSTSMIPGKRMIAFSLLNEEGKTVKALSVIISVKGKRYSF